MDKEKKLWILLIMWVAIRNGFWAAIAIIGAITMLRISGMI